MLNIHILVDKVSVYCSLPFYVIFTFVVSYKLIKVNVCISMVDDLCHSFTGHNNSSSYSGRMLTNEPCNNEVRDAAMHNQLSACNTRNYTATFPPVQANSNDVPLDETSAFNSGTRASTYVPLRDNPTLGRQAQDHMKVSFSLPLNTKYQ
ncbi:hypothetical protein VPH35_116916 [Triticum aestivum]|nr:uncharacterized protein LOC109758296 isoform X1 [Aegilops tauschii subsp. strangulata]